MASGVRNRGTQEGLAHPRSFQCSTIARNRVWGVQGTQESIRKTELSRAQPLSPQQRFEEIFCYFFCPKRIRFDEGAWAESRGWESGGK
jgi:hypothetical protein